jgi:hypothetical protein
MFTLITITGQFDGPDGQPAQGTVTAELSVGLTNGTEIVEIDPVEGCLDSNGRLVLNVESPSEDAPFVLAANDDVGTTPTGSHYRFLIDLDNAPVRSFFATVSRSAVGHTVDLTELEP